MSAPTVAIVRTGVANTRSVAVAFERLGCRVQMAENADAVHSADHLVLPGVGAFAAAVNQLEERGLTAALHERITGERPTLAVCLGLQLLGTGSDESPGAVGLGIASTRASRFDARRVPQLGWNLIRPDTGCELLQSGYCYFANSFRWGEIPDGWHGAWADHGGPFVAAIERGPVLACQFHPELSGSFGSELLRRWLAAGGVTC